MRRKKNLLSPFSLVHVIALAPNLTVYFSCHNFLWVGYNFMHKSHHLPPLLRSVPSTKHFLGLNVDFEFFEVVRNRRDGPIFVALLSAWKSHYINEAGHFPILSMWDASNRPSRPRTASESIAIQSAVSAVESVELYTTRLAHVGALYYMHARTCTHR